MKQLAAQNVHKIFGIQIFCVGINLPDTFRIVYVRHSLQHEYSHPPRIQYIVAKQIWQALLEASSTIRSPKLLNGVAYTAYQSVRSSFGFNYQTFSRRNRTPLSFRCDAGIMFISKSIRLNSDDEITGIKGNPESPT